MTTRAWTSAIRARRPSTATVTQVPETGESGRVQEQAAWVGNFGDAFAGHFEATNFIGWSVAVFEAAHEAKGRLAVALEVADDVDEVFENSRAGD